MLIPVATEVDTFTKVFPHYLSSNAFSCSKIEVWQIYIPRKHYKGLQCFTLGSDQEYSNSHLKMKQTLTMQKDCTLPFAHLFFSLMHGLCV